MQYSFRISTKIRAVLHFPGAHALVNDLPLGRSVDEALRMVDALQFFEEHGEVCPANWHKGEKGMKASAEGVAEYLGSTYADRT